MNAGAPPLDAAAAKLAQPVADALGSALGVDPALVADDLRSALEAARQHSLHAIVGVGVVADKTGVAPLADPGGGDGGLSRGFEAEIVEVALLRVKPRRFNSIAPPCGPGVKANACRDK